MRKFFCLAVMVFVFVQPAFCAEQLYVTDKLQVNLRQAPSSDATSASWIESGDLVTVLSEPSSSSNWVKIRTETGKEGWVLRRYLVEDPPAVVILRTPVARKELENNQINTVFKAEMTALEEQKARLEANIKQMQEDYANSIELRRNLTELQDKMNLQQAKIVELKTENESLTRSSYIRWFLAGGAVLLVGLFIGSIISKRKRNSWNY